MGLAMTDTTYDVVGLGNAIVDIIDAVSEEFLTDWEIRKDGMTLIEEDRARDLTREARSALVTPGGSGANTIAGLASFGADVAYIGKVADDELGKIFRKDMTDDGILFDTPPLPNGPATARCIIFVTPDGARSMNTFLGASVMFSPADVNEDAVRAGKILYLEGYLFDREDAKAAFVHASEIAQAAGRKVSLTLSDSFCVDRHRESFRHLIKHHVDILFANEAELLSLYETEDFDAAVAALRADQAVAAVTRSEKGSVVIGEGDPIEVARRTGGEGGRYNRGRGPVCRRVPLWLCERLAAGALREARPCRRRRSDLPFRTAPGDFVKRTC